MSVGNSKLSERSNLSVEKKGITGTYSRLRKALKGDAHVVDIPKDQSEKDGIRMIASLSCCATLSCFPLFITSNERAM